MSDIRPLSREELLTALCAMKSPAVMVHKNPDGDAVGSAVATVRYLRARGVDAALLSPDPIPERLLFLCEGVPFFEGTPRELVTVDVASPAQAGRLSHLLGECDTVYMIDHHELSRPFAPHYIRPEASAVGEVLYGLFGEVGEALPADIATPLYAAIASDTGCFRFQNVKPETHRVSAALLASGVPAAELARKLFDTRTDGELKAIAYAIENSHSYFDGRLSVLAISRAVLDECGCREEDFDGVIDTVRSRRGVEVAAVIRERADGAVRLSLRTTGADAASLCAVFGGGGHRVAAGCTLPCGSAEEGAVLLLAHADMLFAEAE
jgi:phosphoesterase RecJ-like protein